MKDRALDAFSRGADFVELRLDFLRPEELGPAVANTGEIKSKAIFTLRSKSQGGKYTGSEQDRLSWIRKIAELRPMLVDVELDTLRQHDELADYFDSQKTPVLVSWHDFDRTPPDDEIADILTEMRVYSNYVKIVTTAKSTSDSLRLLELYDEIVGLNAVVFAMGEGGILSRILCTLVGTAPFTYASLDEVVAPGQLTLDEMRAIYDRIEQRFE
jgi:3-dehydroquinate dehydratase-1